MIGLMPVLAQAQYVYQPFIGPLPAWNVWYVLLVPLCAGVAVVWKSVKCESMKLVPAQAAGLLLWILLTMVLAAVGLAVLVKVLEIMSR
jgi:hypothetical protein